MKYNSNVWVCPSIFSAILLSSSTHFVNIWPLPQPICFGGFSRKKKSEHWQDHRSSHFCVLQGKRSYSGADKDFLLEKNPDSWNELALIIIIRIAQLYWIVRNKQQTKWGLLQSNRNRRVCIRYHLKIQQNVVENRLHFHQSEAWT